MGAASSGGSDNQVSGAEAVASEGKLKTYSERQKDKVNEQITEQGRINKESRKSFVEKAFDASLVGKSLNKVRDSKFSQDKNYKSRIAFAKKTGKFTNENLNNRNFVLSSGFKTQLDGMGYSNRIQKGRYGSENDPISQATKTAPTVAEVDQTTIINTEPTETAETTEANRLLKIKKRGRSKSIMTTAKGVTKTSSDYSLGKKSLLGQV